MKGESRIEWLAKLDQSVWDQTVKELLPKAHEIDRLPLRIWFAWWPIKLTRGLSSATDVSDLERHWELRGDFSLEQQLSKTLGIFYAASCWSEVVRSTLNWVEGEGGQEDLETDLLDLILVTGQEVSLESDIDVAFILPLQAVAFMVLCQMGAGSLGKSEVSISSKSVNPNQILKKRQREKGFGILSFLRDADQQHTVCFDEGSGDKFTAYHEQDLSMAAAMDTRDHTAADPRCTEGPIPFQCRSGSCGSCWIGVVGGKERLAPISEYEKRRLQYFGYLSKEDLDTHPPVRLACQSACRGNVTILVPPWNGVLNGRD